MTDVIDWFKDDSQGSPWLAITQGNSRHHWGWFNGDQLIRTESFKADQAPPLPQDYSIWLARVAGPSPSPSAMIRILTLAGIPMTGLYSTLGLDRALALWAAGSYYGWPTLVIDGGTALTISGADGHHQFIGGAIWPGLGLQAQSLHYGTAALPQIEWTGSLPPRWSCTTPEAIRSGILYTVLAGLRDFMNDWILHYPTSSIVFTGGDGAILSTRCFDGWGDQDPLRSSCYTDAQLILRGIALYRAHHLED